MKILVVDDEQAVRDAYRHVLAEEGRDKQTDSVSALAEELFGAAADNLAPRHWEPHAQLDLQFAVQGAQAIEMVREAREAGSPFKVAFIDIRMPPGIDGRETARRIRSIDSEINLVIVTAYSDHSATDIAAVAGPPDKIFYLSKPFSSEEVRQMAYALCRRWDYDTGQVEILRQKVVELAASEARARHVASHDFLTGAPNRMAFQQELGNWAARGDNNYALAFMDLDRFKQVNDTFGHGAGDHLLIAVYELLRKLVPPGGILARLGGDEFGLLIPMTEKEEAQQICQRLVDTCSQTFSIFGNSIRIGASCGLLLAKDYPVREAVEQMRLADLALFCAKESGREKVCIFDEKMDESQRFRQTIEKGLREAIGSNELQLHYQPIVERDSLVTAGFEALLRWVSAEHGTVSPTVFIPIAEESNLINELGEWVLARALEDSRSWPDLFVSINFSPRQFKRSDFFEWIEQHVANSGVNSSKVQIEITETAIFDDAERAARLLRQLQEAGYRVALDDFGTGYSSLFNIKNFSLDCIKIDKSFIDGLGSDRHSAAIVNSIVHLAQALGLSIVAEGVETAAQCQMLRVSGCSHLQGFLFGSAKSADHAIERIRGERVKALGGFGKHSVNA